MTARFEANETGTIVDRFDALEEAIHKIADALPIHYLPEDVAAVMPEGRWSCLLYTTHPVANVRLETEFRKDFGLDVRLTVGPGIEVVSTRWPIRREVDAIRPGNDRP
jgi:hypothetical protein